MEHSTSRMVVTTARFGVARCWWIFAGGTLRQEVWHLVFENATNGIRADKYIEKVQK